MLVLAYVRCYLLDKKIVWKQCWEIMSTWRRIWVHKVIILWFYNFSTIHFSIIVFVPHIMRLFLVSSRNICRGSSCLWDVKFIKLPNWYMSFIVMWDWWEKRYLFGIWIVTQPWGSYPSWEAYWRFNSSWEWSDSE